MKHKKRKRRVEKLRINTALLWKMACNYGEKKMRFVQRMMAEYSSEKIERELFSFKGKGHVTECNRFTYKFVRNALETQKHHNLIGSHSIVMGIKSFDDNEHRQNMKILESIEKLSKHLDLIEDEIELLRMHLKGISENGVDMSLGIIENSKYEIPTVNIGYQLGVSELSEPGLYKFDMRFISYEVTITRPLDNLEWCLNIVEIEIIDLLLEIQRGFIDGKRDFNGSTDVRVRENIVKVSTRYLVRSSNLKICKSPLRNVNNVISIKQIETFMSFCKSKNSFKMVTSSHNSSKVKTIDCRNKITLRNIENNLQGRVLRIFNNPLILFDDNLIHKENNFAIVHYRNNVIYALTIPYEYFQTVISTIKSLVAASKANESNSSNVFNTSLQLVNKNTVGYAVRSCNINYPFQYNVISYLSKIKKYFAQSETNNFCKEISLTSDKFDNASSINKTKGKTYFLTMSQHCQCESPIINKTLVEERCPNKDCLLDYCELNGRSTENTSNRDLSLDANTKQIKCGEIMKLKSKAFTLAHDKIIPSESLITKESCVSNNDFQKTPVKKEHEEENILKVKVERKILKTRKRVTEDNFGTTNSKNISLLRQNIAVSSSDIRNTENNVVVKRNTSKTNEFVSCLANKDDRHIKQRTFDSKCVDTSGLDNIFSNEHYENISKDIIDLQGRVYKNCQEMEDISFHFDQLNDKFSNNSKQNRTDVKSIYVYIHSLQKSFTTSMKLMMLKMNSITQHENKTKQNMTRKVRKTFADLKSCEKSINCLKYTVESKLIINEEDNKKLRRKLVTAKYKFDSYIKFNSLNIHKIMDNSKTLKKCVSLKLRATSCKMDKMSNKLNCEYKSLKKLIHENNDRINDAMNDINRVDITTEHKFEIHENAVSTTTERVDNLEMRLCDMTTFLQEKFETFQNRLDCLEGNLKLFHTDRKQMRTTITNLDHRVNNSEEIIEDNSNRMKTLRNSTLANKHLIDCMFEEISMLKRKFDIEIRTQNEINKNAESNLEALNKIIKRNTAANRHIGVDELKKFKSTMKRNTLASTASCGNLQKLSNQIDTTVIYVQTNIERILTRLHIPNTNAMSDIINEHFNCDNSQNETGEESGHKDESVTFLKNSLQKYFL